MDPDLGPASKCAPVHESVEDHITIKRERLKVEATLNCSMVVCSLCVSGWDGLCSLADEAALHAMFACKGASGLKVCMWCANVFNAKLVVDSEELSRLGGVTHTCGDTRRLPLQTDDSLKAIQTRLREAKRAENKRTLEELEEARRPRKKEGG